MALVFMDGFDFYQTYDAGNRGWTNGGNLVAGRFGGLAQSVSSLSGNPAFHYLPSAYTTLIAGFALKPNGNNRNFYYFYNGGSAIAKVGISSANKLTIANGSGTVIATGTTNLTIGAYSYIEFKVFVNGASGSCQASLNGISEIGATTGDFGSTAIDRIGYHDSADGTSQFDDFYVLDTTGPAPRNTFLGDVRIATIYPTADGTHSQWTPNSGSPHFSRVNETQEDGDASYVSDATPGDIDTYAFGDIDTNATVYGIQTNLVARKDDAATRQIAPLVRQSTTDYAGTTVTLGSSYVIYSQIYNQDPTGSDWTPTTVNANEFGVKEVA